jgi:LmbE family N-acetylglucosaminyl deacetylase
VISTTLPTASSVLVVCAHPDDESFGLGAVLAAFVDQGARTAVLCFTRGEASTLHAAEGDLATVRSREFAQAAAVLGVSRSELLDYPDGHLADQSLSEITAHVVRMVKEVGADLLLTFDEGGITGHLDHEQATHAAVASGTSCGVPVLAWVLADEVASALNSEFGSEFLGRCDDQLDFRVPIDRTLQSEAITCHVSQSASNPVLRRRLQLSGEVEQLRWLTPAQSFSRTTS